MRQVRRTLLAGLAGLAGAAVLLAPARALAGGWARDAGGVYLRAGAAVFRGQDAFLLPDVEGVPAGRFRSVAAELYGEVGLGHDLEVDLSLRWVDNRHALEDGPTLHNRGAEDGELLLKWAPVNESQALSLLVGTRFAMYRRLPVEETLDGRPQRGPGGADVLFGASYGHSFHPLPMWLNLDLLHRVRLGGPSSGQLIRLELGAMPIEGLGGALTFEVQPAFGRDIDQRDDAPSPVPKVLALGGKAFVPIYAGLGLTADAQWLPDALNDGPGWRVGAGLTFER